MTDLIMSCSYGYSYAALYPFIRSLKDTGYSGEIVLFVAGTDAATCRSLEAEGIQLIHFHYPHKEIRNPLYRLWPIVRPIIALFDNPRTISRLAAPFQNLLLLRDLLFYSYLIENPGRHRDVILTDLRDVFFQANPFTPVPPGKLRAYLEEPPLTMGTCKFNSRWLREVFGEETLKRMGDKPIACGGTIRADQPTMITYLEAVIRLIRETRSSFRVGTDQALHNIVVHERIPELVTLCPNGESEVLTMARMPRDGAFPRDAEGRIVDAEGRPYCLLHQFDRHASLKAEVLQRYTLAS